MTTALSVIDMQMGMAWRTQSGRARAHPGADFAQAMTADQVAGLLTA